MVDVEPDWTDFTSALNAVFVGETKEAALLERIDTFIQAGKQRDIASGGNPNRGWTMVGELMRTYVTTGNTRSLYRLFTPTDYERTQTESSPHTASVLTRMNYRGLDRDGDINALAPDEPSIMHLFSWSLTHKAAGFGSEPAMVCAKLLGSFSSLSDEALCAALAQTAQKLGNPLGQLQVATIGLLESPVELLRLYKGYVNFFVDDYTQGTDRLRSVSIESELTATNHRNLLTWARERGLISDDDRFDLVAEVNAISETGTNEHLHTAMACLARQGAYILHFSDNTDRIASFDSALTETLGQRLVYTERAAHHAYRFGSSVADDGVTTIGGRAQFNAGRTLPDADVKSQDVRVYLQDVEYQHALHTAAIKRPNGLQQYLR